MSLRQARTAGNEYCGAVLPPDLPVPEECPDCGAEWGGWTVTDSQGYLGKRCVNGHDHRYALSPEEALRTELALYPGVLISRPSIFVGGPQDGETEEDGIYGDSEVGEIGDFSGARYRVESVDAERVVWVFDPMEEY